MNSNRLRVLLVALVAVLSASLGAALASAAPWNAGGAEPRPTAAADAYRATEDEVLARSADDGVLANDVGAADATLIIGVTHGALTLDSDGSFVYTPEPDFSGRDSFTYRADNEAGEGNLAMVTITVGAVNDQPVAVADAYSVSEDGALEVPAIAGVLANDSDKEADALTVLLLSGVGHGSLTLEADGSFSYAPERDFTGTDEFTYRATDGSDDSQAVTVTIAVTAHNDAPLAADDAYGVAEDGALTVSAPDGVLANDTDAEEDVLTAVLEDDPRHGTLNISADGSFTYRPGADFYGTDTFTYRASDGSTSSTLATVTIAVATVDDAPVAVADVYSVAEDGTLRRSASLGVLTNDADPDGEELSAALVRTVSHGTLQLSPDGSFTYLPTRNFSGVDSFSYRASDGGGRSNSATVSIAVKPVNDAPVARNDHFSVQQPALLSRSAGAGLLANDSDVDGDTIVATLLTAPLHGTLSLHPNGSFTYWPKANFSGTDAFSYRTSDGQGGSGLATVTIVVIAPPNRAPVAQHDSYTIVEDGVLARSAPHGLLANDGDADGDVLRAQVVALPVHGWLSLLPDGSFTYQPARDFSGIDQFTYRANDGTAYGNVARVTVIVTPRNDAPVARDDHYGLEQGRTLRVHAARGVLINDTDADGDVLTALLIKSPAHGTLSLHGDGSFSYKPDDDFDGTDSFAYVASDGKVVTPSATVRIVVTASNHAPVAKDDEYHMHEGGVLIVPASSGVLANDGDPDGDKLTAQPVVHIVPSPQHGTLVLQSDGSFTYHPRHDFTGVDSFTYSADDGRGGSDTASVTITVAPDENRAPRAEDDRYRVEQGETLKIRPADGVLANDSDADGDALAAELVDGPFHGELDFELDGSFTYRPRERFSSVDYFTYRLTDGSSGSAMATVIVVVETEDPLPEACEELGVSPEVRVLCSVLRLLPEQSQPEIERIIERYSDDDQGLEIEFKRRRGDRWELTIRLSDGDFAVSHWNERDKIRIDLDSELEDEWRYWDEFLDGHQAGEADDD